MKKPPAKAHQGHKDKILVLCLLDANHFLDLLGQGFVLFLLSPTTMMVLMPMAGFLLHQPALGDRARLFLEVAVVLARVAHRRSPPSFQAAFTVAIDKRLPADMGS